MEMGKLIRNLVTASFILLVLGLAFYPKLKGIWSEDGKEKGKGDKQMTDKPKEGSGDKKGKDDKGGGDKKGGSSGGGKGGSTPINVTVVRGQKLDDKILTTGTIIPNEEVEIRSEISGRITQIAFSEGQNVSKGQTLLKMNDADLQAQLEKLGFQKKLAQVNEERQKKLLEKEAISQREYDISVTNLNSIGADIENLKVQIAKTVVKAPFSGRIGLRYASLGSYISPANKITTLTSTVPAKIDFAVPAKYASTVGRGTVVSFTTENAAGKYNGTVYAVEPKIDPNTRTVMLRATSPNSNHALVPGAFAKVEIVLKSKMAAIIVPAEAVIPDSKGHKVFVVKQNKAEPVIVEIGTRTDTSVEIASGLSIGDTLITSGILMVKPGGEVDIKQVNNR